MTDIVKRLKARQALIQEGYVHTCGPLCTRADCLVVCALGEIERLRGLLDQVETLAVNNRTGCGTCVTVTNLVAGQYAADQPTEVVK